MAYSTRPRTLPSAWAEPLGNIGSIAGTAAGAYFGIPFLGAAGGQAGQMLGNMIDPPQTIMSLDPKSITPDIIPYEPYGSEGAEPSATEKAVNIGPSVIGTLSSQMDDPNQLNPTRGDRVKQLLELQAQRGPRVVANDDPWEVRDPIAELARLGFTI
jgi:hypothetical protein